MTREMDEIDEQNVMEWITPYDFTYTQISSQIAQGEHGYLE
jgi:hypothetical protein